MKMATWLAKGIEYGKIIQYSCSHAPQIAQQNASDQLETSGHCKITTCTGG
jgi:hypothetical protein